MAHYDARAGIDSYLTYAEETVFASAGNFAASAGVFGIIKGFTPTMKRNLQRIKGTVGVLPAANTTSTSRDALYILPKQFESGVSIDFIPQDWAWLKYVMGSISGLGTSASKFNYPQATAATDPIKRQYLKIPSISLSTNYYFEGSVDSANKSWRFLGNKVDSFNIKGKFGDVCTSTLTTKNATVTGSASLDAGVALSTTEPYNFTGVSIEYPAGTPIPNIIDSFDLTVANTVDMIYGTGTDIAQDAKEKERNFDLKIVVKMEGTGFMDDFMGAATAMGSPVEINEIKIILASTTANKQLIIHCLRCKLDEDNTPNNYPDVIDETLTLIPQVVYFEEQTTA